MKRASSGNVLLYVLIAVALFGMISFALTRQLGNGGMTGTIDSNKAKLKAEELINYATAMRSAAEQMRTMGNVLPNEFSFVKEGDAGYSTAPHTAKIFHPAGGGMNAFTPSAELFASGSAARGWVGQVGTNVEWTATTGSDVIYTFLDVAPAICKAINERLVKDDTVPVTSLDPSKVFINGGGDDADLSISDCTGCGQRASFCVETTDGDAFYNVILSR